MTIYAANSTIFFDSLVTVPTAFAVDRSRLDQGLIEGYAARYGKGENKKAFKPGCFRGTLNHYSACGTLPPMVWNGNQADVIGRWTSMVEDGHGLRVTGQLALNTERGSMVRQEILSGIDGLSTCFLATGKDAESYTEAQVFAVSLMRQAAIPEAPEALNMPPHFANATDFEKWLRGKGVSKTAAKKLAAGGWPRLQSQDTDDDDAAEKLDRALKQANHELSLYRR